MSAVGATRRLIRGTMIWGGGQRVVCQQVKCRTVIFRGAGRQPAWRCALIASPRVPPLCSALEPRRTAILSRGGCLISPMSGRSLHLDLT